MNKNNIIILITIIIGIVVGFILFIKTDKIYRAEDTNQNTISQIVGGDRDIHGCIPSAGYSWCEAKSKCLRIWEEKCEVAQAPTQDKKLSCEGKGGVWFIDNNTCEINSLSKEECLAQGGEFNECASACRHDPTAEVCTMQCVLTCMFK